MWRCGAGLRSALRTADVEEEKKHLRRSAGSLPVNMEFEESFVIKRIDKMNFSSAAERMQMMTVHCQQCNTVMADSFGVCGEVKCMDSLLCLSRSNMKIQKKNNKKN